MFILIAISICKGDQLDKPTGCSGGHFIV